jgi:hypothetical protein
MLKSAAQSITVNSLAIKALEEEVEKESAEYDPDWQALPKMKPPLLDNIPIELMDRPQWVGWRYENRGGKLTKVPVNPPTGKHADTTNPKTWASIQEALNATETYSLDGIGFVFSESDPYTGIDLDSCIDPDTGGLQPWAHQWVDSFQSYTEVTPSGKGLHIIVEGRLPDGSRHRKKKIEVYDKERFFTFTGNTLEGRSQIASRQAELDHFLLKTFETPQEKTTDWLSNLDDEELLKRAREAENGGKFSKLFDEGEWEAVGYPSQSEADLALCKMLAFWTGRDKERMDRLFRRSGLYRKKWKQSYSNSTMDKAINECEEIYTPPQAEPEKYSNAQPIAPSDLTSRIQQMNQKHAVVMLGGKFLIMNEIVDPVFNRPTITFSTISDFKNYYATDKVEVSNGNGTKLVSIAPVWLDSPERRQYEGIVMAPGRDVPGYYNLYRGFAVNPEKGDWHLNKTHIFEVICNSDLQAYDYLINWMAYIVQNIQSGTGKRPEVAVVMKGGRGAGKGTFVQGFGRLFGSHFLHVTHPNHFLGRFNFHLKDALLLFADEAFWAGDKTSEGVLKGLITEERIFIEPKGKDSFAVQNHVNVIIASNNDWVIPAGLDERRFFVLEVSEARKQDYAYFEALRKEMENGGREAMLYELLHMDLSGVNLRNVPQTKGLLEQKLLSADSVTKFWHSRLQEGSQLREDDHWTTFVETQKLYDEYSRYAKTLGYKHIEDVTVFVKKLRELCPDITGPRKRTVEGIRRIGYLFPPLDKCREKFEEVVKIPIQWQEIADE